MFVVTICSSKTLHTEIPTHALFPVNCLFFVHGMCVWLINNRHMIIVKIKLLLIGLGLPLHVHVCVHLQFLRELCI